MAAAKHARRDPLLQFFDLKSDGIFHLVSPPSCFGILRRLHARSLDAGEKCSPFVTPRTSSVSFWTKMNFHGAGPKIAGGPCGEHNCAAYGRLRGSPQRGSVDVLPRVLTERAASCCLDQVPPRQDYAAWWGSSSYAITGASAEEKDPIRP